MQVSRDGGMSWTCYRIDTCGWANGAMIEVEPDVVAFLYGGKGNLRGQLLKVTPDDLICITGSFYLVGETKHKFLARSLAQ